MVLELAGDRAVLGPVPGVVRPHRQLVDQHPAVAGLEQLDRQHAGDARARRRRAWRSAAPATARSGSRSGAGAITSWQMPSRCVEATTGQAATCPDGERATSADSSRRKSTRSSARMLGAGLEGGRAVVGSVDEPDPLAVVPAAGGLQDAREAEAPRRRRRRRRARCAGRARPAPPAGRASPPCPGRAPARRDQAALRASASSACRCSVGTCSWSKVTTSQPAVTSRSVARSV